IRDRNVTGVQTCALPISSDGIGKRSPDVNIRIHDFDRVNAVWTGRLSYLKSITQRKPVSPITPGCNVIDGVAASNSYKGASHQRSEERRVGKECRSRRAR